MLNAGFCYKNLEKYDEAGQLLNKGIITLEYLDKVFVQNGGLIKGIVVRSTHMLVLIE
jgi:hypothetical protein